MTYVQKRNASICCVSELSTVYRQGWLPVSLPDVLAWKRFPRCCGFRKEYMLGYRQGEPAFQNAERSWRRNECSQLPRTSFVYYNLVFSGWSAHFIYLRHALLFPRTTHRYPRKRAPSSRNSCMSWDTRTTTRAGILSSSSSSRATVNHVLFAAEAWSYSFPPLPTPLSESARLLRYSTLHS